MRNSHDFLFSSLPLSLIAWNAGIERLDIHGDLPLNLGRCWSTVGTSGCFGKTSISESNGNFTNWAYGNGWVKFLSGNPNILDSGGVVYEGTWEARISAESKTYASLSESDIWTIGWVIHWLSRGRELSSFHQKSGIVRVGRSAARSLAPADSALILLRKDLPWAIRPKNWVK